MNIREYFKLEKLEDAQDADTRADFIEHVASCDMIDIKSVEELDYSREEWNQYRDDFLDV